MKTKLFLIALIATFATLPSFASDVLTPEHSTSETYLKNYGHSETMIEMIQKTKAKANGEEYVTKQEQHTAEHLVLVSWVKKVFMYLDPALDNGTFMNHDIKTNPGAHDL